MIGLSVIIPTYNRRELLLRTLNSLASQTLASSEFEVVVVVDGSSDGTVDSLTNLKTAFSLKSLFQENRGQAAARNTGAEHASGEILLFIDDDVTCTNDLLAQHLAQSQEALNAVVFGPIFLAESSIPSLPAEAYRRYAESRFSRIHEFGPRLPQDAMLAPNSSLHVDLFRKVGGYDCTLERLEDIEIGYKLWKTGAKFVYVDKLIAFHTYDKDDEKLVSIDAPRFGISDLKLSRMHPEYRPYSTIRRFVQERRPLARLAASLPFSPDPVLAALYWATTSIHAYGFAIRLLQIRQGIAAVRSAVTFAGGWAALERELSTRDTHA